MTIDEFFAGYALPREIFDGVRNAIDALGPNEIRISKSQISFRRRKAFAWLWMPCRYLRGKTAPLVLTLSFHNRDGSPRWKEIVQPAPGRFTHHLELFTTADIDDEVSAWLRDAWAEAS